MKRSGLLVRASVTSFVSSFVFSISMSVFAAPPGGAVPSEQPSSINEQDCPIPTKLKNMCMIVGNHMKDQSADGKFEFLFQRRFFEAACIKDSDSAEMKREKISSAWKVGEGNYLACTSVDFDIHKGNILKYAIAKKFDEFIDQAIEWKVDLNQVDDSDKKTVLDYVKYYIDKNDGNAIESLYRRYYTRLARAGAKHSITSDGLDH